MKKFGYLFEARGIQRFLFATGKLKDMVDGSELIDFICAPEGYLEQVLKTLGLNPKKPRCAGGVFYLVFEHKEEAQRLQNAWRVAAARWFPTLECVDALAEGDNVREVIQKGLSLLAQNRNIIQADLPAASPLTARSPRTGLAASSRERGEALDAATTAIRRFERPQHSASVTDRFLQEPGIYWPNNFESDAHATRRFPLGQRQLIGLIHADGNNLGVLLRVLNDACANAEDDTYIDLYQTFSEGVTKATINAAKDACEAVIRHQAVNNVLPARPLVLGGDDLSVIVRADLAIEFTQVFLEAFKRHSRMAISELKAKFGNEMQAASEKLPDCLTACAGIVYVKASQPFYSAYAVAEELCKRAKNAAKPLQTTGQIVPSALSFYKVSDSLLNGLDKMLEQTQLAQHEHNGRSLDYQLGLDCYRIDGDETEQLPLLDDLQELKLRLRSGDTELNDRGLRELATVLHTDLNLAKQAYKRWVQYANSQSQQNPSEQKRYSHEKAVAAFQRQLASLIGPLESDLPVALKAGSTEKYQTVLSDLLALLVVEQEAPFTQGGMA